MVKKDLNSDYPTSLVKNIIQRRQTDLEKWSALVAYQYCDSTIIEEKPFQEFLKSCLKHDPKDIDSKIRRRALKVLLLRVETETALVSLNCAFYFLLENMSSCN